MPRFRKKAIEVEAVQWTGENREEVEALLGVGEEVRPLGLRLEIRKRVDVGTVLYASVGSGDWLIRHPDGTLTTCPIQLFEATYEPVGQERGELEGQAVSLRELRGLLVAARGAGNAARAEAIDSAIEILASHLSSQPVLGVGGDEAVEAVARVLHPGAFASSDDSNLQFPTETQRERERARGLARRCLEALEEVGS